MEECLFCKIIKGKIPNYTIYEDEIVKVFLDIHPSTNGDCLIIPKKHIVTIDEVENELMVHILKVIKQLRILFKEKLDCDGLTISQNNDFGQEIKHFHIHVTPRYLKDGLEHTFNEKLLVNPEDVYDQLKD